MATLLWNSLGGNRFNSGTPKTLIRQFFYPRLGPGMMWSRMREMIERQSAARVVLNTPVEAIHWERGRVSAVRAGGTVYTGEHFISTIPIRELIGRLSPAPPEELRHATDDFNYRDFIIVALMVRGNNLFPDNWIYIHDPKVAVGRIQNYGNWSPEMTPDPSTTCLGFEYFCQQGDALWKTSDQDLAARAAQELAHLGLAGKSAVIDAKVVRVPKAYPVYDAVYRRGIAAVREFLRGVPNLQLVGRNGMHRYNNQDHSMLTAMTAVENIIHGVTAKDNIWSVNTEQEYHETKIQ